jgi:hypothetical protein
MKKSLLSLLALAAYTSAGAYTASQVTSLSQIVDGETYAIVAHIPSGDRILTLDGTNTSFASLSSDVATSIANTATHWQIKVSEGDFCSHSATGNQDHGTVYTISQNGRYWTHAKGTSLATSTEAGELSKFEFHTITTTASNLGATNCFAIMGDYVLSSKGTYSQFQYLLAVNSSGSEDQLTRTSLDYNVNTYYTGWISKTYDYSYYSDNSSIYFLIYKVEAELADKVNDLREEYKAKCADFAASYGVSFDTSVYAAKIDAVDAASEADLEAAAAQMKQISDESLSAQVQAVKDYYGSHYFTMRNCGNSYYVGATTAYNETYQGTFTTRATALSAAYVWKATVSGNADGLYISFYNPFADLYIAGESSVAPSRRILTEHAAAAYEFTSNSADGSRLLLHNGSDYVHNNNLDELQLYTDASYLTNDYTNWQIAELTAEQQAAIYAALVAAANQLTYSDGTTTSMGLTDASLYGNGLNHYSDPLGALQAEFAAKVTDEAEFLDVIAAYKETVATAATLDASAKGNGINMPAAGTFIRVKAGPSQAANLTNGMGYLTAVNASGKDQATVVYSLEDEAAQLNSIFYYTGENLVGFANGLHMRGGDGVHLHSDATDLTPFSISLVESLNEAGTYLLQFASGNYFNPLRYLYINTDGLVNGGQSSSLSGIESSSNAIGYHLHLEAVESLPVTIGADATASVCFPVAVTIPAEATCFVAKVDGTDIKFIKAAAGDSYAAQTPIFVTGTAGDVVNFAIAAEGSADYVSDEFTGNYAVSAFSAADGTITYVPAAAEAAAVDADFESDLNAVVHFVKASGNLPANAPILTISESILNGANAHESVSMTLDSDVEEEQSVSLVATLTAITELITEDEAAEEAVSYDLLGRRLANPSAARIRIVGGKLMVK